MPSGSIYGPTGAFGPPGPTNTQTQMPAQTGVAGGTPGQGTSSNPWGTTGNVFDPQNLGGGSTFAQTTYVPPISTGTATPDLNQWGTTTSLYGGTQGIGADGTTNQGGDGFNYLSPRDKVTNSLFDFKLGSGNPNGLFNVKLR